MSKTDQPQPPAEKITLPISWHYPESIQSRYVTNMLVQIGEHEIIASFFETQIPLLLGKPEENKAKLEQQGSFVAECVARIIVAPERLPGFIDALKVGLEQYQALKEALEGARKDDE